MAKGISQDDLALSAGVERAYVGHLERASRNPTVLTLAKLADSLEIDIGEFFLRPDIDDVPPPTLKAGRKKR